MISNEVLAENVSRLTSPYPGRIFITGRDWTDNVRFVWKMLNPGTRCSIAGKEINRLTGEFQYSRILNRNWRQLHPLPE